MFFKAEFKSFKFFEHKGSFKFLWKHLHKNISYAHFGHIYVDVYTCVFIIVIISSVHVFETWWPKTSTICKQYCLLWEDVDAVESKKKLSRQTRFWMKPINVDGPENGALNYIPGILPHILQWNSVQWNYYTVPGIFWLKLLVSFHWKPFWNVKISFILSNWDNIDHFQRHCIVLIYHHTHSIHHYNYTIYCIIFSHSLRTTYVPLMFLMNQNFCF